jgi:hypothetical protein
MTYGRNGTYPGLSVVGGVGRGIGGTSDGSSAAPTSSAIVPDMISHAKRHCGRTAQRFVDAAEIVEAHPKRDRCAVILKLLTEPIGEPRATAHLHPG